MKKSVLLVLGLFILFGFIGVVSAEEYCSDTDGVDLSVQGSVSDELLVNNDECVVMYNPLYHQGFYFERYGVKYERINSCSSGVGCYLAEFYCNSSNMKEVVIYQCSGGCVSGKCVSLSEEETFTFPNYVEDSATCTDSDKINYFFRGRVDSVRDLLGHELEGGLYYQDECLREKQSYDQGYKFELEGVYYADLYSCNAGGVGGCYVSDYYCKTSDQAGVIVQKCAHGCLNGACKTYTPECVDTDAGQDFENKGVVTVKSVFGEETFEDECFNPERLNEYYCMSSGNQGNWYTFCENGCEEGRCLEAPVLEDPSEEAPVLEDPSEEAEEELLDEQESGLVLGEDIIQEVEMITPTEETGPINMPKAVEVESKSPDEEDDSLMEDAESVEEQVYLCFGCELGEKCYPFGYRKSYSYCFDETKIFVSQKNFEESCENSFECRSNFCVDDECTSPGFFTKIIDWFRKLFGSD